MASKVNAPPAPPPPPSRAVAPPPPEPDVEMYKAKFAFEGQEGEMTLKKDDLVELVEKEDNGWWLVKKDGVEGWAPNNYLELVPHKPKAAPAPPPPPPPPPANRRPPSVVPTAPTAGKSIAADPSAKPVAVFPGMAASNGSAAPWKRTASAATNGSSVDTTPTSSRPGSAMAPKPPALAAKPKPGPPPIAHKPGAPSVPGKPPVPGAARPPAGAPKPKAGGVAKPAAIGGQLDLAAAVSEAYYLSFSGTDRMWAVGKTGAEDSRGRLKNRESQRTCADYSVSASTAATMSCHAGMSDVL